MKETKDLYEFGGFRFDLESNTLWLGRERVSLSTKPLELLKLLISRPGEIVSKQEIFESVWAGTFVEDGVLTQNIYLLRQTLGPAEDGKPVIENIARRGYRFVLPVSLIKRTEITETQGVSQVNEVQKGPEIAKAASPRKLIWWAVAVLGCIGILLSAIFLYRSFTLTGTAITAGELKFTRLTDNGDVSYLTISPDGNWVAFTRGFDVYVRDLRTNAETKIRSEATGKIGCLQFAPDNSTVYYGSVFNRDEKGTISRISITGGEPEVVATDVWSGFSVSPDGSELAFVRKVPAKNGQELIRKSLADGAEQTVAATTLPEEFYWNNYPAWSADGKKLAVVEVSQTEHFSRIVISENGVQSEFKPTGFRNIEQSVWTADGQGFIASANEGDSFQIWKFSMTDGSSSRITNDLNSYLGIATSLDRKHLVSRQRVYYSNIWAGNKAGIDDLKQFTDGTSRNDGLNGMAWIDEERLVYAANDQRIRDWNLWILNTSDGTRKKITNDTDVQNDFPAASPDQRTIYFASDRSKQRRIWRIDTEGGGLEQVTFGEDEAHLFPQVSPDGKHLYFIIKSGRTSNIGRASLTERSVQELSGKTKFVPGNFLSLSPDGKFLAFQNISYQPQQDGPPKLQLAVLSTENPDDVSFLEVNALRPWIAWDPDNNSLEYVNGGVKETAIYRRSLGETGEGVPFSSPIQATTFNFKWSRSGEKIAVSRGQLLRDVVMLTNFDR